MTPLPSPGAPSATASAERARSHWMRSIFERRGAETLSLVLVAAAGVCGAAQVGPNGLWVAVLLGVTVHEFQKRIDQGLPLLQIAAFVATLQWVVGPLLAYTVSEGQDRYIMYVEAPAYFSFALPGTAAFVVGLLAVGYSVKQRGVLQAVTDDHFVAKGVILYAIAFGARALAPDFGGGLAFVFHMLSQLSYVGALYFVFSRSILRWPMAAIGLYPLVQTSAASAMFHDLILWGLLLFCFVYGRRQRATFGKASLLVVGTLCLFTLQSVKHDYRARVWSGQEASLVDAVGAFLSSGEAMTGEAVIAGAVARLNQGWIISAVLRNVPENEPHADGETLSDAVVAALVPRVLMPDKVGAGGQENFRRFTGLPLADGTSMGISPLGEAYANFGRGGGVALMLGYGLLFALVYRFSLRRVVKHPDFLFWIPLIFYQTLKAETEFVTVLNQMSKGMVIGYGMHWLLATKLGPLFFSEVRALDRSAPRGAFEAAGMRR